VITAPAKQLTRERAGAAIWSAARVAQTVYGGASKHAGHPGEKGAHGLKTSRLGMIVKNMSFSVYAGEVVGIAGLIGSGRPKSPRSSTVRLSATW